jgi:hypothetical protein
MTFRRPLAVLLAAALTACLGSVDIGGTLSGLPSGSSVTLQNNGTDNLTLTADGSFTFADAIGDGETYSVTVLTQPVGATCTVTSGSGTVSESSSSSITSVVVTCTATAAITGTVSGLNSGFNLVLQNVGSNGTTDLTVTANGNWAFAGTPTSGSTYAVTVKTQPPGQTCTVASGTGTYTTGTATAVRVTCA